MNKNVIVRQIQVKDVMTKSNAPIGGYCVNPYVGCTHGCKYCYASFMKRFTGHTHGRMGNVFGCQKLAADQESG